MTWWRRFWNGPEPEHHGRAWAWQEWGRVVRADPTVEGHPTPLVPPVPRYAGTRHVPGARLRRVSARVLRLRQKG